MLGQFIRYIILSCIITISLSGHAQTSVDSLRNRLAEARSLRDSVMLLYNIYDNSPASLQGRTLDDLFELAMRREDYITASDALKRSADHYADNDSMVEVIIGRAKKLPDGSDKQSTQTYITVVATPHQVSMLDEDQREDELREYIARHSLAENFDTFKRIEYLFQLCTYLSQTTEGELLTNYLQELQTLLDNLPSRDLPLKLLFYRQAAPSYMANGMVQEAVEADKMLLGIIDEFQQQYAAMGRTSRSYGKSAYQSYDRLLRNHEALTQDEVEDYYARIMPLISRDTTLQMLSGDGRKPNIYHLMAKKRYASAIPLIKEQLSDSNNTGEEQMYLVDALLKAAEAVGNKEDQLTALEMSNAMLKDRIKNKATKSYKELQTVNEVNDLQEANDELTLANQQIAIKRHKGQLVFAIICLIVLAIVVAIVFVLYRRSKHLASNLTEANALIMKERDALQRTQEELIEASEKARLANRMKTDFVSNMGHEIRTLLESIVEYSGLIADCADPDRREYIKQFADVITLNTDMLLTLVNDVLSLPSLENAKVGAHITETSVQDICQTVIDSVSSHIKPGVDLIFANGGHPDTIVMTDARRVEQVLLNLMTNAAKFTDRGTVTLDYTISSDERQLIFTVTDTGIGIPAGKEEQIFSRMEKSGNSNADNCLSLYISRMIADMLGGSLTLDGEYRAGAKFTFTIPIS